jgi:hypothetical protein
MTGPGVFPVSVKGSCGTATASKRSVADWFALDEAQGST